MKLLRIILPPIVVFVLVASVTEGIVRSISRRCMIRHRRKLNCLCRS